MGKKPFNEKNNFKSNVFNNSTLKHILRAIQFPTFILSLTLIAIFSLPHLGKKIVELSSHLTISESSHECTFINLASQDQRQHIEKLVTECSKKMPLVNGIERMGTSLLKKIPGIASITCSLDRDHIIRLVITGNEQTKHTKEQTPENTLKESTPMQVLQHQAPPFLLKKTAEINQNKRKRKTFFFDRFDMLLSTTNTLQIKPEELFNSLHAQTNNLQNQPQNRIERFKTIINTKNDFDFFDQEIPPSCKRNRL